MADVWLARRSKQMMGSGFGSGWLKRWLEREGCLPAEKMLLLSLKGMGNLI